MTLFEIQYVRDEGTPKEWRIVGSPSGDNSLRIENINLIVGQNATGKSNTVSIIRDLADLVCGDRKLSNLKFPVRYDVKFYSDDNKIYEYSFCYNGSKVITELLKIDGRTMLDRSKNEMFYSGLNKSILFKTDDNSLAITRRDSEQQDYIEPIYQWGKSLSAYSFGSNLGKDLYIRDIKDSFSFDFNFKETDKVSGMCAKALAEFSDLKSIILEDMKSIGYSLSDIKVDRVSDVQVEAYGISVKEDALPVYTDQFHMSQGMFRALSLCVQIEYSLKKECPSCILIDDIGEGLDYERSHNLIELLINKAKHTNLQLIMTTNDRFVMNHIPLKYWQVINRVGNKSVFYNIKNSKDVFNSFAMTGLNNFDFFASKFYINGIKELGK